MISIKDLTDFSGNEYYIAELEPAGYMIYNKESGVIVESSDYAPSPYTDHNSDIYYAGPTYYFYKDDEGKESYIINPMEYGFVPYEGFNINEGPFMLQFPYHLFPYHLEGEDRIPLYTIQAFYCADPNNEIYEEDTKNYGYDFLYGGKRYPVKGNIREVYDFYQSLNCYECSMSENEITIKGKFKKEKSERFQDMTVTIEFTEENSKTYACYNFSLQ